MMLEEQSLFSVVEMLGIESTVYVFISVNSAKISKYEWTKCQILDDNGFVG